MIKKLRIRFIRITMLSVAIVLFAIMGTINVLNYRQVIKNADGILSVLSENKGAFPSQGNFPPSDQPSGPADREYPERDDDFEDDTDDLSDDMEDYLEEAVPGRESETDRPQMPGGMGGPERSGGLFGLFSAGNTLTAETPFESRYFTVTVDKSGTVTETVLDNIASVDADDAEEYAESAFTSGSENGFLNDYRYLKIKEDTGTRIIFLDCQRSLSGFRSFLLISILVSAFGVLAVFLLVILFSKRVMRPVQESYDKQKRFITDAGHELKTPLTTIDADAAVLEMEIGENEWLNDVKLQTKRLAGLTGDLVYLARMDEGIGHLQMIDFSFSDLAAETAQSYRSRAMLADKTFESSIEPMITLHGDEKAFGQLVSILLDNALKYSSERGRIAISLKKKGRFAELSVYNTVESVDSGSLSRMFDRFYRGDESRNSSAGGYGIGLSIAQAVVASHKGKIRAVSDDGKSVRITAEIPLAKSH